jgi:hypothetical protein
MVPVRPSAAAFSAVVDAGELGGIGSWLRGLDEVTVRAAGGGLVFTSRRAADDALVFASGRAADDRSVLTPGRADNYALVLTGEGSERRCAAIDEAFPDYRAMLAGLGAVRTRVVAGRDALLTVLDDGGAAPVVFSIDGSGLFVTSNEQLGPGFVTCGGQLWPDSPRCPEPQPSSSLHIPAAVTGPGIELAFSPKTLRPALVSAIGPEIMLDIAAADAPVIVRSATDGDLTTLVMPTSIPNSKEYCA